MVLDTPRYRNGEFAALTQGTPLAGQVERGAGILALDCSAGDIPLATPAALRMFAARDAQDLEALLLRGEDPGSRRLREAVASIADWRVGAPRLERLRFSLRRTSELLSVFLMRADGPQGPMLFVAAAPLLPSIPGEIDGGPPIVDEGPPQPKVVAPAPRRFVWRMDETGRFTIDGLDDLLGLCAPQAAETLERMRARTGFDADGDLSRRLSRGESFADLAVLWPRPDGREPVRARLSGAPVFGPGRSPSGFRGFGLAARAEPYGTFEPMAAPEPLQSIFESVDIAEHTNLVASAVAQQTEAVAEPLVVVAPAPPVNVVPIRPGAFVAPTPPTKESEAERNASEFGNTVELSATERDAFRELARTLGARIRKSPRPQEVANAPSDLVEVPAAHTQIALETEKAPHPVIDDFAAQSAMLDAIPSAVLVFVGSGPVFANREARDWLGDCPQLPLKLAEIFGSGSAPPLTPNAPPIDAVLVAADGREKAARLRGRTGEWRGKEALYVTIETASAPPNEGADVKARAFSANIVHEIRTPLNAILGFAEIMAEERFGPVGNDRYRQYLKDIRASGAHIMSLVNDLLDLAKLESGRTELDPVAIDANRVVRECVGMMQPQAEREKIILRQSLTERLPRVLADERALRQILLNLLSNAVKFNGPGGQVIVSTAVDDGGAAVIRVRDTGIGMDAADIDAAMQPFRQVGERKRGKEGTGLGLPLTKALADASNAGFSIKSAKDQGTLVEVAFPVARAAAQ